MLIVVFGCFMWLFVVVIVAALIRLAAAIHCATMLESGSLQDINGNWQMARTAEEKDTGLRAHFEIMPLKHCGKEGISKDLTVQTRVLW